MKRASRKDVDAPVLAHMTAITFLLLFKALKDVKQRVEDLEDFALCAAASTSSQVAQGETMKRAAKKDSTARQLVSDLRSLGGSVEILNAAGVPDLLVGYKGANWLLEVKTQRGQLTPAQKEWLALWRGQATLVHFLADARVVIGC